MKRPFGRGLTLLRGRKLTMVVNHLLNGMILQVGNGWAGWCSTPTYLRPFARHLVGKMVIQAAHLLITIRTAIGNGWCLTIHFKLLVALGFIKSLSVKSPNQKDLRSFRRKQQWSWNSADRQKASSSIDDWWIKQWHQQSDDRWLVKRILAAPQEEGVNKALLRETNG